MTLTLEIAYTFEQALTDGVLLDVTELAESIGFQADVLVSMAYFADPVIGRTEHGLACALEELSWVFGHGDPRETQNDDLDGRLHISYPRGQSKKHAYLQNYLHVRRTGSGRLFLIVLARGEELDFRLMRSPSGGSFYTQ